MTAARPQLAAVLAALTDLPVDEVAALVHLRLVHLLGRADDPTELLGFHDATGAVVRTAVLHITSVAEAWEVLETRGLIPHGYVGRFVCELCDRFHGESLATLSSCGECKRVLRTRDPAPASPHPATIPNLVAWASLGFAASDDGSPGILGHEEQAEREAHGWDVRWRIATMPHLPQPQRVTIHKYTGRVNVVVPPFTPA